MQKAQAITQGMMEHCRKLIAQDDGTEKVLVYVRENGLWKIQSIKAIIELLGVRVGKAQEIVECSKTRSPKNESKQ